MATKKEVAPVIEKGVPIPATRMNGPSIVLRQMKVKDSVVLPLAQRKAAITAAGRLGMKVVTRTIDEETIRLWRVK